MNFKTCIALLSLIAETVVAETVLSTGKCTVGDIENVIHTNFRDIPAGTRVYTGDPVNAINVCTQIDFDKYNEGDVVSILLAKVFPGCSDKSHENPTCTAIRTTLDTFQQLEEMGCAPLFRNYLPAWTNSSQSDVACKSGSFDIKTMSFNEGGENGCNSFALCDMLLTVMTLSANQEQTGTCGPTSLFTALSQAGPVRALRLATEIVWIGKTSYMSNNPCYYIYYMVPGVQDLKNKGSSGQYPEFVQNPGIEFMFTQSFNTAYFSHSTGGCTPEGNQLILPDGSNEKDVEQFQGEHADFIVHVCKGMVDANYDCSLNNAPGPINPFPTLDYNSASYWFSFPKMADPNAVTQFELFASGNITAQEVTSASAQEFIEGLLCSISPNGAMSLEEVVEEATNFGPNALGINIPRITLEQLNEACQSANMNERAVIVEIASSALQDDGTTGCDHFVVLHSCDVAKDEYMIWSWASMFNMTAKQLVGNATDDQPGGAICSLMTAAPTSNERYVYPEPTPCDPGVCHVFCDEGGDEEVSTGLRGGSIVAVN
mmetsp:Transcript_9309/g.21628  ORF Transcript_9309/g.21628 Transcript_9309/m.21628 type:complete len:544 (+) Transcript_9309:136-1767(+)